MGRSKSQKKKIKQGRNNPCLCGSGKKYKRCCGGSSQNLIPKFPQKEVNYDFLRANELIRQQQQGLGRSIITSKHFDQQLVAVGDTIYHSPKWKTFPDFLDEYMKTILGSEWGNSELKKPFKDRHTILQWYHEYCMYQRKYLKTDGEVVTSPMTGVVYCYLGLAYSLYLLKHNVELQNLLIKRLKNHPNFQGAYYELIVANSLIRAGFKLVLEDETDGVSKHCEFAAISTSTGKRYWVEAKMRSVRGLMGKTAKDGTANPDPLSELIKHLNRALKKPAQDERLIFIDLNTDPSFDQRPEWVERAAVKLEYREKKLDPDQSAYVFVTNMPFHRLLHSEKSGFSILAHGLNIPDFGKPGTYRVSEKYRLKQKHIDAHNIMNAFQKYPQLPSTFDGSLPSSNKGISNNRIIIGETYFFEGAGKDGKGEVVTVTSASVNESEKFAYVGSSNGNIFKVPMSDNEISDYKSHPEAYFGKIQRPNKEAKDIYEVFEIILDSHKNTPKSRLLELMKDSHDYDSLKKMSQEDIAIEFAERSCIALERRLTLKEK